MIADWSPEFGAPTSGGSLTIAIYLVACLASLYAVLRDKPQNAAAWLGIFIQVGLLTINKYFDVQTWFADIMREEAHISGWYGSRRVFQHIFFISCVVMFLLITFWIIPLINRRGYALSIAMLSTFFLTIFVCVRAVSLHSIDSFLGSPVMGVSMNDVFERCGIAVTAISALVVRRSAFPGKR